LAGVSSVLLSPPFAQIDFGRTYPPKTALQSQFTGGGNRARQPRQSRSKPQQIMVKA
jgi:hypothetical protein